MNFFYHMASEVIDHWSISRNLGQSFEFKKIFSGLFYFFQFFNDHFFDLSFINYKYQNNSTVYLPFSGLVIYFGFIESLFNLLKKIKKYFLY